MFNTFVDDDGRLRGPLLPYSPVDLGSTTNPFLNIHAGGFNIPAGATKRLHQFALVAGTKTIANTTVTANTRIFMTRKTLGGTVGNLSYTISAGVGYTVNSSSNTDTSTIDVLLVEAA